MVYLNFFFYSFVFIFAVIGAMRGWAREILVTFSAVAGLFTITVLERYVDVITQSFATPGSSAQFWLRFIILGMLSFFGYQTPNIARIAQGKFVRERLSDSLLGFILGAINAYLIIGSSWYFMAAANYPFKYIVPPDINTEVGQAAVRLVALMVPAWLGIPYIYFAVVVAFIFVIVVFI